MPEAARGGQLTTHAHHLQMKKGEEEKEDEEEIEEEKGAEKEGEKEGEKEEGGG